VHWPTVCHGTRFEVPLEVARVNHYYPRKRCENAGYDCFAVFDDSIERFVKDRQEEYDTYLQKALNYDFGSLRGQRVGSTEGVEISSGIELIIVPMLVVFLIIVWHFYPKRGRRTSRNQVKRV